MDKQKHKKAKNEIFIGNPKDKKEFNNYKYSKRDEILTKIITHEEIKILAKGSARNVAQDVAMMAVKHCESALSQFRLEIKEIRIYEEEKEDKKKFMIGCQDITLKRIN